MNEMFVFCKHCTHEAGIMRGDKDFVCSRCKRVNLLGWGLKDVLDKHEYFTGETLVILKDITLENPNE